MASVICAKESDSLGEKEDLKKAMDAEDQRIDNSEQNQMGDDEERLKGLETCEFLVCSVLAFGVVHINNLKVKDLRVILCYHFGLENLKGVPKKVELVETITDFSRKYQEGLV